MKKLAFLCLFLTSAVFAETSTHVAFVRADSMESLQVAIQDAIPEIISGRYRRMNDSCNWGTRKVYAVEVNGLRYRVDRHGNLEAYYSAAIKYSCND